MKIIQLDSKDIDKKLSEINKKLSTFDEKIYNDTSKIVRDVEKNGDRALFRLTKKFDGLHLNSDTVRVSRQEIAESESAIPADIVAKLKTARDRIRDYQRRKLPEAYTYRDELGNELGWLVKPLQRVGIYVPGGKAAYPSTVLMTAVPAKVAGVREIAIATPCPGGRVNPYVLAAASVAGVEEIYKIGGAQSVAALAFGTESVKRVDKIVGPGNIYVTIAKKIVYGTVDIDMIAGPSEILIIADGSCPASWVASDLLAQAEHDEMAVPTVVTTSQDYAGQVREETASQLRQLKRKKIAGRSVENNGIIYVVEDIKQAARISNAIAPEHLELCVKRPKSLLKMIEHAGAVFLGSMSTESFGDYICGPSHVLPTGGAARFSSPLSVYDFIKMPSVISMTKKGFRALSDTVIDLAEVEELEAHALSVKKRLQ